MKDADAISAELERTGTIVDGFRDCARSGRTVDLSGLERNVETLCQAIAALPTAHRAPLKPRLVDLIDRVNSLVSALGEQQQAISESMKGVTSRHRAMSAYGKGAGTTAPPSRGRKR